MAIYQPPSLHDEHDQVIELIGQLRRDMRLRVGETQRWYGTLRKAAFARAVQGSNSIEGYNASLEDAAAILDEEPPLETNAETMNALVGYRDAMTYVLQIGKDEHAVVDEGLIKSLHFMMLKHDLPKWPGRWRPGEIHVSNSESREIVYTGPDADQVPELIGELVEQAASTDEPVLVRAAMAHLNLAMIHPFRDGNGRMARCLQTLVLAKEQIVAPVFSSIEEYLGRNTQAYYDVLAETGRGSWNPGNDADPWIRFSLTAHYRQARTVQRRIEEIENLWRECAVSARAAGLSDRAAAGLVEVALGFRLRRGSYIQSVLTTEGEEISDQTATRELQAMVRSGLLTAVGERRGRYYVAAPAVESIRASVRSGRPPRAQEDPFELVQSGAQLELGE